MAEPLVNDTLWEMIAPLLPAVAPRPKGGRPRLGDREALSGILLVLKTGIPWEQLPQDLGYGSGMTCWRRLREWQLAGAWPGLQDVLVAHLALAGEIDWARASVDEAGSLRRGAHRLPGTHPAQPEARQTQ